MYRCQLCQTVVPAKQRSTKIVLKTRPRTYNQRGEIAASSAAVSPGRGMPRKQPEYDKGGVGSEIVQEAMVCSKCAEKFAAEQQAVAAAAAATEAVTSEVSM